MRIIVAGITTLKQYLNVISEDTESLRPERCIHCGLAQLQHHGHYDRKPDRRRLNQHSLNPVPILRFYCRGCNRTCSVLPECIPPHRWYLWCVQQQVLMALLSGHSLRAVAKPEDDIIHQPNTPLGTSPKNELDNKEPDFPVETPPSPPMDEPTHTAEFTGDDEQTPQQQPSRSTCKRWWNHLKDRFLQYRDVLRTHMSELGRSLDFNDFWQRYFATQSLSQAMLWCNNQGVFVP